MRKRRDYGDAPVCDECYQALILIELQKIEPGFQVQHAMCPSWHPIEDIDSLQVPDTMKRDLKVLERFMRKFHEGYFEPRKPLCPAEIDGGE